jgi:hypothetical protein
MKIKTNVKAGVGPGMDDLSKFSWGGGTNHQP